MALFICVKSAPRKITSFLLILLGFTPLLFVLAITIKKHDIRKRMNEEMEYRELQTIIIPANQVVWMDKHEIWVDNQMFDIHTREIKNGVYYFTGLFDAEETEMVEEEKKNGHRKKTQNQLLTKLFKCLPDFFYGEQFESYRDYYPPGLNLFRQENIPHPIREIITPPPRLIA